METLYLLVPMSLALVVVIVVALWWALRVGQYDDLDRPGEAILLDNDRPPVTPAVTPPAMHDDRTDRTDGPEAERVDSSRAISVPAITAKPSPARWVDATGSREP